MKVKFDRAVSCEGFFDYKHGGVYETVGLDSNLLAKWLEQGICHVVESGNDNLKEEDASGETETSGSDSASDGD